MGSESDQLPSTLLPSTLLCADDIEDGEIDAEAEVVDRKRSRLDELHEANRITSAQANHPANAAYVPLDRSCFVYSRITQRQPGIEPLVLCFAASYMQRYLRCKQPTFSAWNRGNRRFAARPPKNETEAILLLYYVACVGLAQKTIGGHEVRFCTSATCGDILYRFPRPELIIVYEFEIMRLLKFTLCPRLAAPADRC